jgi:hypothetical protein
MEELYVTSKCVRQILKQTLTSQGYHVLVHRATSGFKFIIDWCFSSPYSVCIAAGNWGAEMAIAVAPRISPSELLRQYSFSKIYVFDKLPLTHRQQVVLDLKASGRLEKLLVSPFDPLTSKGSSRQGIITCEGQQGQPFARRNKIPMSSLLPLPLFIAGCPCLAACVCQGRGWQLHRVFSLMDAKLLVDKS